MRYQILGSIIGDDAGGDAGGGFDLAKLLDVGLSSAGKISSGAVQQARASKAKAKSAAEAQALLAAAIQSDQQAKDALGQSIYSAGLPDKTEAEADKAAADAALQAMSAAGALVPPELQGKRYQAAQAMVKDAAGDYQKKAKGGDKAAAASAKAYWQAAQRIATMVANAQLRGAADTGLPKLDAAPSEGFLSRHKVAIGGTVGAVVLATIAAILLKRFA